MLQLGRVIHRRLSRVDRARALGGLVLAKPLRGAVAEHHAVRRAAGLCWVPRTGYSGELGYEIFCATDHAAELWGELTGAGARPYGLAAIEMLRIESGLIFIGYDYFQHETDPFDLRLDKVIRLDTGDFHGEAALEETAKSPPRRMVTLVVETASCRSTVPNETAPVAPAVPTTQA
jgi:glycine cleavage system aminomethyltransferase T